MNALETIRSRRSIRKYKEGTEIPKEDLKQILEAAMMAPSACNPEHSPRGERTWLWHLLVRRLSEGRAYGSGTRSSWH